jgi:N6-adenosine-specific RNA methylase IME4
MRRRIRQNTDITNSNAGLNKRKDVGTWFAAPRGARHSEKPAEFYKLVESCSPGPYLEIFARQKRPGWTCVGGEI